MRVNCEKCTMSIPNYECLTRHYMNVPEDSYMSIRAGKCKICSAHNPQNIKKHKRYRIPEDLEAHLKSQHKTEQVTVKVKCAHCTEKFDHYYELAKHYLSKHDDEYRSKYCGICDLCSMAAQMDSLLPGGTPDTVYPTYTELKKHWQTAHWSGMTEDAKHWQTAHWSGMTEDAKQLVTENKLGLTRGSM